MKKILVLLMILILPVATWAEEAAPSAEVPQTEYRTEQIDNVDETTEVTPAPDTQTTPPTTANPDDGNLQKIGEGVMDQTMNGNITVEGLGNKILDKLYEVAGLLKRIAAPISIICFIVGAMMMVLGALGKRDGVRGGVMVCVLSVIMFAVCWYAEEIIVAVAQWMVS